MPNFFSMERATVCSTARRPANIRAGVTSSFLALEV